MDQLFPINHNGQRVLTTSQLAESFGADGAIISNNFKRNESRYTEGKHFFCLEGDELRIFKSTVHQNDDSLLRVNRLYLWTEKGAWMHAKSLNTDRAWEAYEMLVDDYYTVKQQSIDVSQLSPELQMFKQIFDGVAKMQIEAAQTRQELTKVQATVAVMKDTFLQRDEDWRDSINKMLNSAAYRAGGNYQELRTDSYNILEERAHCDLKKRVRFLKERLAEGGATKTRINAVGRMDVIEADPRLREIYTTIVKELSIGTL